MTHDMSHANKFYTTLFHPFQKVLSSFLASQCPKITEKFIRWRVCNGVL